MTEEKTCEHCSEVHGPHLILPNEEVVATALKMWKMMRPDDLTIDYYGTAFVEALKAADKGGLDEDEACQFALIFVSACSVSKHLVDEWRKKIEAEKPNGPLT